MGNHLTKLQIIYLAAVLACVVAVVILFVGLKATDHRLDAQVDKQARLAQQLCHTFSEARTTSNSSIREPLRATEFAIAQILRRAAMRQKDPHAAQELNAEAQQFEYFGRSVKDVGVVPCRFGG